MWQYLTDNDIANGENSAKSPMVALTLFMYSLTIIVIVAKMPKRDDTNYGTKEYYALTVVQCQPVAGKNMNFSDIVSALCIS